MIRWVLLAPLPAPLLALAAASAAWAADPPATLAIVHAEAWTATDTATAPIADATILMADGRILAVGADLGVPPGARVIDAQGAPVTPGLYNADTQLGLQEVSSAPDTVDTRAQAPHIGAGFDPASALTGNSTLVALARSDGLTGATVVPLGTALAPFAGLAVRASLRDGDDILGAAAVALVVTIDGDGNAAAGSRAAQWQTLARALDEARDPPPPAQATLAREDARALRAVLAGTLPIAIRTHRQSDIRQALALVAQDHLRAILLGAAEAWREAGAIANAHVGVVIDPEANLPSSFDALGATPAAAAILRRAGVVVAFGDVGTVIGQSYNAGLALREAAGRAVANGLTRMDALRAVTSAPRRMLGDAAAGAIAPGAPADLVVWDGDPFEVSTNPVAVVVAGRIVSLDNRQLDLARRYLPH